MPLCNLLPLGCSRQLGETGLEDEKGRQSVRRTAMITMAVALMVALSTGVAVAASLTGTGGRGVIDGTGRGS